MAIELTLLEETKRIAAAGVPVGATEIVAEFIANGKVIKPTKVVEFYQFGDFVNRFSFKASLTFLIGGGVWNNEIYPFRRDLRINVYRIPLAALGTEVLVSKAIEKFTYKVVLEETGNSNLTAPKSSATSQTLADLSDFREHTVQLIDPVIEQLRLRTIGTNLRDCKSGDALRAILTKETRQVRVDEVVAPLGVVMVPANNQEVRKHVVIPQGTYLTDLARLMQQKCGGVYTAGIASFYNQRHWYVFPPFNTSLYAKSKNTLTIAKLPEKEIMGLEATYNQVGNSVYILSTGEMTYMDSTEHQQLNEGNGTRFMLASKAINGLGAVSKNKLTVDRSSNVTEVVSERRPDLQDNVPYRGMTNNQCYELSKLAERQGSVIQLVWENAKPSLLVPGMPTKLMYSENDMIYSLEGVLIGVENFNVLNGPAGTSDRHLTQSVLTLFMKRSEIDQSRGV